MENEDQSELEVLKSLGIIPTDGNAVTDEELSVLQGLGVSMGTPEPQPYSAANIRADQEAGASNSQIVDRMLESGAGVLDVNGQPFDIQGARENKVSDDEIVQILSTGIPYREMADGALGQAEAGAMGINYGISNILGMPVDLMNQGLGAIEGAGRSAIDYVAGTNLSENQVYPIDEPFLGSESIRSGLEAVGVDVPEDSRELPPEYRYIFQGGRVVGENAPLLLAPWAMALRTAGQGASAVQKAHPLIQNIINNPTRFALGEAAATSGAVQGAMIAQYISPDNPWAQMGGEFIGSLVSPLSLTVKAAGATLDQASGLKRAIQTSFGGTDGANNAATQQLLRIAQDNNVSPDQLLSALQSADNVSGANLTAGQLTGDPLFLAVERSLAETVESFNGVRQQNVLDAFANLRAMSDRLMQSSDETVRNLGSQMQKNYFANLLDTTVNNARNAAVEATRPFADTDAVGASRAAYQALQDAKYQARAVETAMWSRIDRNTQLNGDNISSAFSNLGERVLEDFGGRFGDSETDTVIRNFMSAVQSGTVRSGDMLRFRSYMLRQSRQAASGSNPDYVRAGIYDELAAGALADLETMPTSYQVESARTFSRMLNERFSDGFPATALQRGGQGSPRINPEDTLPTAMTGTGTSTSRNLREMREATGFADEASAKADEILNAETSLDVQTQNLLDDRTGTLTDQRPEGPPLLADPNAPNPEQINVENRNVGASLAEEAGTRVELGPEMEVAQDQFIRNLVFELRNTDGTIDAARLDQFIQNNPRLMQDFPNIRTDIEAASQAQKYVDEMMTDFGNVQTNEDLVRSVNETLTGRQPEAGLERIIDLAKTGDDPEMATSGVRSALVEWASGPAANTATGEFDFIRFGQRITQPVNSNGKSVIDMMVENGIVTPEQAEGMVNLVGEGIRLQTVDMSPQAVDQVIEGNALMFDNLSRIIGANVGTRFGIGQASLQSAAIGSAYFKNLTSQVPQLKTREAMVTLLRNPDLLADYISRNPTVQETARERLSAFAATVRDRGVGGNISAAVGATGRGIASIPDRVAAGANTATYGAVLANPDEFEETPLPSSLEDEMMGLGIQP